MFMVFSRVGQKVVLYLVLVQILKQDWPHNWPTFIGDLVASSRASECLCENNMNILKLLSEEVFEFSRDTMTSSKVATMKASLNEEFLKIFELCQLILDASQRASLVGATLVTLQKFMSWIPLGYIFETTLLPTLINKFFPVPVFRTATIDCLTEISALNIDSAAQYFPTLQQMLVIFNQQLQTVIPAHADLATLYESGNTDKLSSSFFHFESLLIYNSK
jgi:exportin-1